MDENVSSFDQSLVRARQDSTVSDEQIAALENAAQTDAMSYQEMSVLLADTFACFDDAGVAYRVDPDREIVPGFVVPQYSVSADSLDVADACQAAHSEYAFSAFQTQPVVIEAADQALESRRPQVLQCLRDQEVTVDDDATLEELRVMAWDVFMAVPDQDPALMCTAFL